MFIAMIAGILTNIFDKEVQKPAFSINSNKGVVNNFGVMPANFSLNVSDEKEESSCCSTTTTSCCSSTKEKQGFSFSKAMKYAFGTLLRDISKPLIWGLLFGALITAFIPQNLGDILKEYSWLSYIIAIIIAVPMYVCATASLPIAAGLMLSGVSAGAAFVFLSAGPATNTVTIGVVKKMLGTKSLYIYLGSIIFGSVIFGLGLDYIFSINDINPASLIHIHEESGLTSIVSSIVLWTLILYHTYKLKYS
jgi:uncharacterized membrane protein YraQ (UPF0718 family)